MTTQHRPIRSFVRRQGRITPSQQQALTTLWPIYGLEQLTQPLDFTDLFGRQAPIVLEIGFGMGHSLLTQAQQHPERNFLGIEVHKPGVGSLLANIAKTGVTNIRLICADAVTILSQAIADQSLDTVQIFFPDPWPKARHHKRRLIQPAFVELVTQKLTWGGKLHVATDWEEYAMFIRDVLTHSAHLTNTAAEDFVPRPESRPLTKFEQRGYRLGHQSWDLVFEKKPG